MRRSKLFKTILEGKNIQLEISKRALKWLETNQEPTYIGLELYFSCFITKYVVNLQEKPDRELFEVHNNLFLYFRPVQSKSCNIHDLIGKNSPTLIDFPIAKRKSIIPNHIQLDIKKSKWVGDFTWKKY